MTEAKYARALAIQYKCWECMGKYLDGKDDCENTSCPLYPFMPYAMKEPSQEYLKFSPRHKGETPIEDTKRELTEDQRMGISERFKKYHEEKKEGV